MDSMRTSFSILDSMAEAAAEAAKEAAKVVVPLVVVPLVVVPVVVVPVVVVPLVPSTCLNRDRRSSARVNPPNNCGAIPALPRAIWERGKGPSLLEWGKDSEKRGE